VADDALFEKAAGWWIEVHATGPNGEHLGLKSELIGDGKHDAEIFQGLGNLMGQFIMHGVRPDLEEL